MGLLIVRCLLALVFAAAAAGKLLDRAGFRRALGELGAPARAAGALVIAIPAVELAVAALLVPAGTAQPAAWAALGLLLVFSAAVSAAIGRGERSDCGCFGSRPSPVGSGTLLRNSLLGAAAAAIAIAGPGAALGEVELTGATVFALAVALGLAALGAVGWQLSQQNGRLLERVRALEAQALASGIDPQANRALEPSQAERD